ncbi:hypothetical protein EDD37DRAFT_682123 [Exophiala viscosa]|uniref:uncharacterized protein n=1 Tax=Exophiala viscosa TaxID=2486360 RepID=UPI00219F2FFD|nr:hypothetical protein EDD37DRAFT_682123 [Exophiala viscosa]
MCTLSTTARTHQFHNLQLPPKSPFDYCLAENSALSHALTTLAETLTLRFAAGGAFVILSDGNTQYVLAGFVEEHGIVQLLGHNDADLKIWAHPDQPVVVHDASRNKFLKDLSAVAGSPGLRFCAAVPIVSKADIAIGYVLVGDTREHGETSDRELNQISSVAKQCMSQLEQDYDLCLERRWSRMVQGLSAFLQRPPALDQMLEEPPNYSEAYHQVISHHLAEGKSSEEEPEEPSEDSAASRPQQSNETSSRKRKQKQSGEGQDETPYRRVFRRSAEFLREALGADGVIFADGLISFHGTLHPAAEPEQEPEKEMAEANQDKVSAADAEDLQETASSRNFTSAEFRKHVRTHNPSEILGIAMQSETIKPAFQNLSPSTLGLDHVDEGFLQYLMGKFVDGQVWFFSDGPYCCQGHTVASDDTDDTKRLLQAFPGIRQLMFAPLKDPVDIKRLAGCFVWSTRTQPIFANDDLPSLDTFLHTVEAEISRIDTIAALKQKESFMASVSHELRSPLHGILGAVEFLVESGLDNFQESLADTIRACGTILHETLSSVLSFTKINQFERRRDDPRQNMPGMSPWSLENKDLARREDSEGMLVWTNIAELCEEIVEVVVSGDQSDLKISLDIAYRDWNFLTEPGALRRVMMNVIGNALKYTSNGGVEISLRTEKNHGNEENSAEVHPDQIVVFTVKDSGQGMSKAFLENHLFVPFSQENSMSDGVGLGMSIVKSLVALLAGEMQVESHVGEGTTFAISIPMRAAHHEAVLEKNTVALRDRTLKVVMSSPDIDHMLRPYSEQWFGCKVVPWNEADVAFISAEELSARKYEGPKIVAVGKRTAKSKQHSNTTNVISEPIGPVKVSKALLRCMKSDEGKVMTDISADAPVETSVEDPPDISPQQRLECLSIGNDLSDQGLDDANAVRTASSPGELNRKMSDEKSEPTPGPNGATSSAKGNTSTPYAISTNVGPPKDITPAILLVEDNLINLRLLQTYMKKRGYKDIHTANNGLVAVQAVEKRTDGFSIVVMDISMPEMDGFEATRRIRELERQHGLPQSLIIALTGLARAADRTNAYEAGVDHYMTKPLKFQELGSLLTDWEAERK